MHLCVRYSRKSNSRAGTVRPHPPSSSPSNPFIGRAACPISNPFMASRWVWGKSFDACRILNGHRSTTGRPKFFLSSENRTSLDLNIGTHVLNLPGCFLPFGSTAIEYSGESSSKKKNIIHPQPQKSLSPLSLSLSLSSSSEAFLLLFSLFVHKRPHFHAAFIGKVRVTDEREAATVTSPFF